MGIRVLSSPALLLSLLLLGRLYIAFVKAANAVSHGRERKSFKHIAMFRSHVQKSLCQVVVVELLGLGVVE